MKKTRISLLLFTALTAAFLVAFFVCMINIGDLIGSGDLSEEFATVLIVLLTAIPTFCFPVIAAGLVVVWILLLAKKKQYGSAETLLVILSVFLPVVLFSLGLNMMLAERSAVFAALIALTGGTYLTAFALSIAYVVFLARERKRVREET